VVAGILDGVCNSTSTHCQVALNGAGPSLGEIGGTILGSRILHRTSEKRVRPMVVAIVGALGIMKLVRRFRA
jgi:uncharacterized membrane protein YfcA